ncbi:MAG: hypothetical protein PHG25_02580 [Candidatus Pacebacteria bacterium]|nr:hypothetical protein [Candidatus Paceibacterota bacterium]
MSHHIPEIIIGGFLGTLLGILTLHRTFRPLSKTKSVEIVTEIHPPGSGLRSVDGTEVAISIGPKRDALPPSNEHIALESPSKKTRVSKCGHVGPKTYHLNLYGIRSIEFSAKEAECPSCLTARIKKEIIRCAVCGLPICPGEGVALYSIESPGIRKEIATIVDDAVIGCLRWSCCPSGGFFAGHWTEKGFTPIDWKEYELETTK